MRFGQQLRKYLNLILNLHTMCGVIWLQLGSVDCIFLFPIALYKLDWVLLIRQSIFLYEISDWSQQSRVHKVTTHLVQLRPLVLCFYCQVNNQKKEYKNVGLTTELPRLDELGRGRHELVEPAHLRGAAEVRQGSGGHRLEHRPRL